MPQPQTLYYSTIYAMPSNPDKHTPKPLHESDVVAIIAPATTIKGEYVAGAVDALGKLGWRVRVMPHALGPADGSYASSEDNRFRDFVDAYSDPEVRAILCARGGYGCIHFIDRIDREFLAADPKWVIGFSDISALHAMMHRAGVRSIHSSMAKHLTLFPSEDPCNSALVSILRGDRTLRYSCAPDERDIPGIATGELRGGNLAVLDGLAGTPFDMLVPGRDEDVILFIEDIGEAIYRTERMVRRLALCGALKRYKGIIVGQFTESKSDLNYNSTADMLRHRLRQWGAGDVPIAFNFPIGHTDTNYPVVIGSEARLEVSGQGSLLALTF